MPNPLAVREFLAMRESSGAATLEEIYSALENGGFKFEGDFAKRGLGISLAKNTRMFHKLPNETFGLAEWYPNAKKSRNGSSVKDSSVDENERGENEKSLGTIEQTKE